LIVLNSFGQLMLDNAEPLSEDTYCFNLSPNEVKTDEEQWVLLGETNIDTTSNREIFRIITMSLTGDPNSMYIKTLESIDSVCRLSIKVVQNLRKNQGTLHIKTFDLSVWDNFKQLADTTFWNQEEVIKMKGYILDGGITIYEFNDKGKYHKVIRTSGTERTKEASTSLYLSKLTGTFYPANCKKASR